LTSVPNFIALTPTSADAAQITILCIDKSLGLIKCICGKRIWPWQDVALDITFGKITHMHTKCKGTEGYV